MSLGYILILFAILVVVGGAILIAVSFALGDRQRDDLFIGNLTAAETIRLGRNLILWGIILALVAILLQLIIPSSPSPTAVAPNSTLGNSSAPRAAPVPISAANAPKKSSSGFYQAICVPPKNGGLNLRSAPGNAATVITVIPCNTTSLQPTGATVTQDGGQWVPINYNGTPGWVYGGLIQPIQ